MQMCRLSNSHGLMDEPEELLHHPFVQSRVTVDPILVDQPASGLVKQFNIDSHSGHIRPECRMPKVTGNSPWREKLPQILQCQECSTVCVYRTCDPNSPHRFLPYRTTLHRTPPELTEFQMFIHHMSVNNPCPGGQMPDRPLLNAPSKSCRHAWRRPSISACRLCMVANKAVGQRRRREVTSPGVICRACD